MNTYARFNNKRKKDFDLVTAVRICDGEESFVKYANVPEARPFLEVFPEKYSLLRDQTSFNPVACHLEGEHVFFEQGRGESFDQILMRCVQNHDKEAFLKNIALFDSFLRSNIAQTISTDKEFTKIFGPVKSSAKGKKVEMLSVGCVDISLNNLFYDEAASKCSLIDYEWIFSFPVPYKFVLWRALYMFYQEHSAYQLNQILVPLHDLYDTYDITDVECDIFIQWEYHFQEYVLQKTPWSLEEFRDRIIALETCQPIGQRSFLPSTQKILSIETVIKKYDILRVRKLYWLYKKRK